MSELKYVVHNDTNKPTYLIVRNIVQQNMEAAKSMAKTYGESGNELEGICRGIVHDLEHYPRINTGSLWHWFKVEVLGSSVMVYHTTNLRKKLLLCEVVRKGGENE